MLVHIVVLSLAASASKN